MAKVINNAFLAAATDGLVYSLEAQASRMDSGQSDRYAAPGFSFQTDGGVSRHEMAAPHVIGTVPALKTTGPDMTHDGIVIKAPGSFDVAMPAYFGFVFPTGIAAAQDSLSLYGPERFEASEMILIMQRTDIAPGDAHRAPFGGWHDHLRGPLDIDLIYGFSDALPTDFLLNGRIVQPPAKSLTRFGAEIRHRSPTNRGKEPLRRTWGAVLLCPTQKITRNRHEAPNSALGAKEPIRHEFEGAGRRALRVKRHQFRPRKPAAVPLAEIAAPGQT